MRKRLLVAVLLIGYGFSNVSLAYAQKPSATASAQATVSAEPSSVSVVLPKIPTNDITRVQETKSESQQLLEDQQIGPLSITTFLRHAIRLAVSRGIPINLIVFILLFPIISLVIAMSRHIIGIGGLSIYAPAALAIALLSLGIVPGAVLFVCVLVLASVGHMLLPALKLQYMPRTSLLFWFVSIGMFFLLLASTYLHTASSQLNVFALFILILLSEDFLEIQSNRTGKIAVRRAVETFILGLLCALLIGSQSLQSIVLLYPEATLVLIAFLDILVGKYLGLRLSEWFRFRAIMETEE
ncbi:MAG TPA: 7TM domain-containing protein [Patescibacteria group bacterium]|nr:7TM domain-containing protein [Patescibacteria group bacterium]